MNRRAVVMRNMSTYFVLAVIAALAMWFGTRHRTLEALRAGNDSLRKQVDSEKTARAAAVLEPRVAPVARLNDEDERELMRLRSKIVPLQEQLRDASNRVAVLQQPLPIRDAGPARPAAAMEPFTWAGKQWVGDSNRIAQLLNMDTGPDGRMRISIKGIKSNSPTGAGQNSSPSWQGRAAALP